GEIFDHHSVEFEYADGSRCASQCRHQPGTWDIVGEEVVGTNGVCDVGNNMIRLGSMAKTTAMGHKATWRFSTPGAKDPYQQEHDDLFAAIRNNTPYNELEYGATSSMTAIMGRMATYSGKEIKWEDAINSQIDTMPKVLAWDAE